MIDSADTENTEESRKELKKLLEKDELKNCVILIYANKIDLDESIKIPDLINIYELNKIKTHVWHIQPCSGKTNEGLVDGIHWLSEQIIAKKEKFKVNPYKMTKNEKDKEDLTINSNTSDINISKIITDNNKEIEKEINVEIP